MFVAAVKQTYKLLDNKQRLACLYMFGASCITAGLELVAAIQIVSFAKALNDATITIPITLTMGATFLAKNIFALWEARYQNASIMRMCFKFKDRLLRKYVYADNHEKFIRAEPTYFMHVINTDIDNMFYWGLNPLVLMASELVVFAALYGLIFYYNAPVAIGLGALGLLGYTVIFKLLSPLIVRAGKSLQEAKTKAAVELAQIFDAFTSIVMFGLGDRFIGEYNHASSESCNLQAKLGTIRAMPKIVLECLFMLCVMLGIITLCLCNKITPQLCGILGGFVYIGLRMASSAARVISTIGSFEAVSPAIGKLYVEMTD